MRKLLAALIAILLILILSNNLTLLGILQEERHSATIIRVIDGDTVQIDDGRILRLANINSPEKSSPLSKQATQFMKSFENKSVQIDVIERDKYNRFVARIYAPSYLNEEMVSLGLASKFLVYDEEKRRFARLEKEAIDNGRGIWAHSPYFDCFNLEVNAADEEVSISNSCDIPLSSFYIKDESRKTYKFLNISSSYIELRTGNGNDTADVLYWHSSNVWNNDRDSAYLFDPDNRLAAYYHYGY